MSGVVATAAAPPHPAPPALPAAPLTIERLSLRAFRAFPHEVTLELAGKNLLVYGENGSGKSSIFHALRNFFATRPKAAGGLANICNPNAEADFRVGVTFSGDVAPIDWRMNAHPVRRPVGSEPRVGEAALRKSCLDYRALLDTNYLHGDDEPNLFKIAIDHLLADYTVAAEGGVMKTISQLWSAIDAARPPTRGYSNQPINTACAAFNAAFRSALDAIQPHVQTLLADIPGIGIDVKPFAFAGVTYEDRHFIRDRIIAGQVLVPSIEFNARPTPKPQTFLNEARLSALALAMYLAGRLACVPAEGAGKLKLLVLDDVLIGLDHSNRMPVLEMLRKHFGGWQIIILTHDRVWFDMAKAFHKASGAWTWAEIKADGNDGAATPTIRQDSVDVVQRALDDAKSLITDHLNAAANSARRASEMALQGFAEKRRVKVGYKVDVKDIGPFVLLDAIDEWIGFDGATRGGLQQTINTLRAFLNAALNPQSHANAPNPSTAEVNAAILAVEALRASTVR